MLVLDIHNNQDW